MYTILEKKCPSCNLKDHAFNKCQLLNVKFNKELLIEKFNKRNKNEDRIYFNRKNQKKQNSLNYFSIIKKSQIQYKNRTKKKQLILRNVKSIKKKKN